MVDTEPAELEQLRCGIERLEAALALRRRQPRPSRSALLANCREARERARRGAGRARAGACPVAGRAEHATEELERLRTAAAEQDRLLADVEPSRPPSPRRDDSTSRAGPAAGEHERATTGDRAAADCPRQAGNDREQALARLQEKRDEVAAESSGSTCPSPRRRASTVESSAWTLHQLGTSRAGACGSAKRGAIQSGSTQFSPRCRPPPSTSAASPRNRSGTRRARRDRRPARADPGGARRHTRTARRRRPRRRGAGPAARRGRAARVDAGRDAGRGRRRARAAAGRRRQAREHARRGAGRARGGARPDPQEARPRPRGARRAAGDARRGAGLRPSETSAALRERRRRSRRARRA